MYRSFVGTLKVVWHFRGIRPGFHAKHSHLCPDQRSYIACEAEVGVKFRLSLVYALRVLQFRLSACRFKFCEFVGWFGDYSKSGVK